MTQEAQTILAYLRQKGFNTARETAQECGVDEAGLDAALTEIAAHDYRVCQGIRRESYGREVLWIEPRPPRHPGR